VVGGEEPRREEYTLSFAKLRLDPYSAQYNIATDGTETLLIIMGASNPSSCLDKYGGPGFLHKIVT